MNSLVHKVFTVCKDPDSNVEQKFVVDTPKNCEAMAVQSLESFLWFFVVQSCLRQLHAYQPNSPYCSKENVKTAIVNSSIDPDDKN